MSSGRYLNLIGRAHGLDSAAFNHNGLVFPRRRACSIQDAYVFQGDHWRIHGDERFHARRELRLGNKSTSRGDSDDP
jgi:hypothetical protein